MAEKTLQKQLFELVDRKCEIVPAGLDFVADIVSLIADAGANEPLDAVEEGLRLASANMDRPERNRSASERRVFLAVTAVEDFLEDNGVALKPKILAGLADILRPHIC